jgi:thiol-disulfide isomerase/thioredoxin
MVIRPFVVLCAAVTLLVAPACAQERYGEVYDPEADAAAQIDAALSQAAAEDKQLLILFGANWCHDSRGLAHRLMTDPLLAPLVENHYVVTPVDIGLRHRNLDQLQRFGVAAAYGTPTLIIADAEGALVNTGTVHDWRASDDAGVEDVAAYLAVHAAVPSPIEGPVATVDINAAAMGWTSLTSAATDGRDPELAAYAAGLARSLTRLSLGRESRAQGRAIIARAEAEALGLAVSEDVTETIAARLNRIEQNIAERFERERGEAAEAREAE